MRRVLFSILLVPTAAQLFAKNPEWMNIQCRRINSFALEKHAFLAGSDSGFYEIAKTLINIEDLHPDTVGLPSRSTS